MGVVDEEMPEARLKLSGSLERAVAKEAMEASSSLSSGSVSVPVGTVSA